MTIQTFYLIIGLLLGIPFIVGIFIVVFQLGKRTVWNNDKKAYVFKDTGTEYILYKGTRPENPTDKGSIYYYSDTFILVPQKYTKKYIKSKLAIFIDSAGSLISAPTHNDKKLLPNEKEDLLYSIIEANIGSNAVKALKGVQKGSVILIAIIAFVVGAVAVLGFNYIKEQYSQQQQPVKQQTQTQTSNTTPPIGINIEQ